MPCIFMKLLVTIFLIFHRFQEQASQGSRREQNKGTEIHKDLAKALRLASLDFKPSNVKRHYCAFPRREIRGQPFIWRSHVPAVMRQSLCESCLSWISRTSLSPLCLACSLGLSSLAADHSVFQTQLCAALRHSFSKKKNKYNVSKSKKGKDHWQRNQSTFQRKARLQIRF